MRRVSKLVRFVGLASASLTAVAACGPTRAPESPLLEGIGEPGQADEFSYSLSDEKKIDASALDDDSAKAGMHVVTLYFSGGDAHSCASWKVKVKSSDSKLKLARGEKVEEEDQKLLKLDDGALVGEFQTRGKKPGVRLLANGGATLTFKGWQANCRGDDYITEFDVDRFVASTDGDRVTLVEGMKVEQGRGQLRVRISDAKAAHAGETSVGNAAETPANGG